MTSECNRISHTRSVLSVENHFVNVSNNMSVPKQVLSPEEKTQTSLL